jgi:hypothetical protein
LTPIETSTHTGLRDRALVLAYTFARIGAVVNLKVEDYGFRCYWEPGVIPP